MAHLVGEALELLHRGVHLVGGGALLCVVSEVQLTADVADAT